MTRVCVGEGYPLLGLVEKVTMPGMLVSDLS